MCSEIYLPWGKYGIHGTVYPWFIGKSNASKGCIRMKNKDVNELFKYIPYGTTVTITHQNPVFRTLKSGDVGSDVLKIQKDLKKLGFYKGATNGMFSEALKGSVKKFQREYRCHVTGVANRQTINLILEKYEMLIEQEKSEDILLE